MDWKDEEQINPDGKAFSGNWRAVVVAVSFLVAAAALSIASAIKWALS